jgi:hypothetical protein
VKRIIPIFLAVGLLATSGCISTYVVNNKAKTHWEYEVEGGHDRQVDGQPGYYALLPLAIIADIATGPFQLFFSGAAHSAWASIDGWPRCRSILGGRSEPLSWHAPRFGTRLGRPRRASGSLSQSLQGRIPARFVLNASVRSGTLQPVEKTNACRL